MMDLVAGVDSGGTSTRAVVADRDGTVLGAARREGANPNSHPPEVAAGRIAGALTEALGELDRSRVRACVVGLAGSSKLTDPKIAALFDQTWRELGIEVRVVSDAVAAFASATSAPDGTVLIAGTGSIAGRIRGRRMVSTSGGYGWLLGDEGSAFWLGREAVRATLDAITSGHELGRLALEVLAAAGVPAPSDAPEDRLVAMRRLITAANERPPVELARFAPLVGAVNGDPAARVIMQQAATALARIAVSTRKPDEKTPIVLVGSVLSAEGPIGALVRERLAGSTVLSAADGVLGATWLAAVDAFGEGAARPERERAVLEIDP